MATRVYQGRVDGRVVGSVTATIRSMFVDKDMLIGSPLGGRIYFGAVPSVDITLPAMVFFFLGGGKDPYAGIEKKITAYRVYAESQDDCISIYEQLSAQVHRTTMQKYEDGEIKSVRELSGGQTSRDNETSWWFTLGIVEVVATYVK